MEKRVLRGRCKQTVMKRNSPLRHNVSLFPCAEYGGRHQHAGPVPVHSKRVGRCSQNRGRIIHRGTGRIFPEESITRTIPGWRLKYIDLGNCRLPVIEVPSDLNLTARHPADGAISGAVHYDFCGNVAAVSVPADADSRYGISVPVNSGDDCFIGKVESGFVRFLFHQGAPGGNVQPS